jgi:hypothetical protein
MLAVLGEPTVLGLLPTDPGILASWSIRVAIANASHGQNVSASAIL